MLQDMEMQNSRKMELTPPPPTSRNLRVAGWNETTLSTLLSNYSLGNIYNADEFGLFYQRLPDKSYQLKTEIFRW